MESIIETLIIGFISTVIVSAIGLFLFELFKHPLILLYLIIGLGFLFIMGWCVKNYENFKELLHCNRAVIEQTTPIISYRIPTIAKLQYFEEKYHLSTVQFMIFVHDNQIPFGMNNLDYLEWVALVNELARINTERCDPGDTDE